MNRNRLLLDMATDSIIFPTKPISQEPRPIRQLTTQVPRTSSPPPIKILPRPRPTSDDAPFQIYSIGASPFQMLSRRKDTQIFTMSIEDIDNQLLMDREYRAEEICLSNVEMASQNLDEIKSKLPSHLHEYLDVFDRAQANKLPPHRPSDYRIEILGDVPPPRSKAYRMSLYKLEKVKEYL